jgi:hypothetical protein
MLARFSLHVRAAAKLKHKNVVTSTTTTKSPLLSLSPLSTGADVAVERELRNHEFQREVVVGAEKTLLRQRVWEVRVDSLLKLDRAAKLQSNDETDEEAPR